MVSEQADSRNETPEERADRNLSELLQELRVALPGVQILFAFLLTVPFSNGFTMLNEGQKKLYFAVLLTTVLSTALLIAPSANHRLLFRQHDKKHLVVVSNRLAILGVGVLAIAISGAILLISDILFGTLTTVLSAGASLALFAALWYALPLYRRSKLDEDER